MIDGFLRARDDAGVGEFYNHWEISGISQDKIHVLFGDEDDIEIPATVLFCENEWEAHFEKEKEQARIRWEKLKEQQNQAEVAAAKETLRRAGILNLPPSDGPRPLADDLPGSY